MMHYLSGTWVSLALCVFLGSSIAIAKIYEKPELPLTMPTAEEFVLMTVQQRVEVIAAVQEFVRKVDFKQPQVYGEFRNSPLWRKLWIDEAIAGYFKQGDACIIAGYTSAVEKRKSSGWLGCPTPAFDSWWAKDMNARYKCDPVRSKTILCNPLVFGYPASQDGSGCRKISNSLTKDCGDKSKPSEEVAKDLIQALTEGGKELNPDSTDWNQLKGGFQDLETHCATAGKAGAYNETECGVLSARIKPIREALQAAYVKQQVAKSKITTCPVNSERWKEIQMESNGGDRSKVSAIPKSGSARSLSIATPKAGAVLQFEIPGSGSDPALILKADAGFKVCTISESGIAAAATPPHYDPCTGGAKEGWTDKCSFVDARTLCRDSDGEMVATAKFLSGSESRKFGPQGMIGGKPELGKLIKAGRVKASLLRPTDGMRREVYDEFSKTLAQMVPSKNIRDLSNFDAEIKKVEDRCRALNKSGGIEEGEGAKDNVQKKRAAKKTKGTFHVVKLDKTSDMTMFTCQRLSKDFDPNKPLDADHLQFSKGFAIVVHQGGGGSARGLVEAGNIDEQGDFKESKIYRPGYFAPIADRARDPDAKGKGLRYRLGGLSLCPDTVEGSEPVQYKIYTKGDNIFSVCSGADGKFTPAKDLRGHSVDRGDLVIQSGSHAYVARANAKDPRTCDLYLDGRRIPTVESAKSSSASGSGSGIK